MAEHDIHVHADELEYTADGLRTTEHVVLTVGVHNRVVIERPKRVRAVPIPLGGFPVDEAFPTAVVLAPWLAPAYADVRAGWGGPQKYWQVHGHAQPEGDPSKNKAISDRRAKIVAALLAGDVDALLAMHDEDGWKLAHDQALLRILGCDPGLIDGEPGPMTSAAVERFQRAYVEGEFHGDGPPPRDSGLVADTELGPKTRAAMFDALTARILAGNASPTMHPTHPVIGCSEFNRHPDASGSGHFDRRVALIVHDALPPHHGRAPCVEGDHAVCPVPDGEPCRWYAAHVEEPPEAEVVHTHYDPRWLELPNGKYLLSSLTTVADDEEVQFEVFAAATPIDGPDLPDAATLGESMGSVQTTKPRFGVAQVVWQPPAQFAPSLDGRIETNAGERAVPVFRVTHPRTGTVTYDSWPSNHVAVLFDRSFVDNEFSAHPATSVELIDEAGGFRDRKLASEAQPYDDKHYALRFSGVPPQGRYTLLLRYGDEATLTLLEDVSFASLDDHGPLGRLPPHPETPEAATGRADSGDEAAGEGELRQIDLPLRAPGSTLDDVWMM